MLGIIDKPSTSTLGVVRESIPMPEPEVIAEPVVAPAEPEAPQNPKDWWTGKKQEYKKPQDMKIAMFAGPKAKGFNEIKSPKTFGTTDALPRAEIDDSQVRINSTKLVKPGLYKLGDVMDHPELFVRYPKLKDLPISVYYDPKTRQHEAPYTRAEYGGSTAGIAIEAMPEHGEGWSDDYKKAILHEIQHAIQQTEGYAYETGSSQEYMDKPGEKEAFQTESRFKLNQAERASHPPTDQIPMRGQSAPKPKSFTKVEG